jgi:hypothetical protein
MPEIKFRVAPTDVPHPRDRLAHEVEQLELGRKRITKIHYPKLYASDLRIAEDENRAKYGKYDAIGNHGGPYEVVIEYED